MITADVDPGPVPEDNLPGHHPDLEQDQPDLTAVAERFGTIPPDDRHAGEAGHDRSVVEGVEATIAAGIGLGAGIARAGTVVAGAAARQASRRIGLSR